MRPDLLQPLFASIESLPGVGAKTAKLIAHVVTPKFSQREQAIIADLILCLPTAVTDRRYLCTISQLPVSGIATLNVTVGDHHPSQVRSRPYTIEVFDDTGAMQLIFFKTFGEQLAKLLPRGEKRIISGTIDWFRATPKIAHPDYILKPELADQLPLLEPVYPLTAGLSLKIMGKVTRAAMDRMPDCPEWQNDAWLKRQDWPSFNEALRRLHLPSEPSAVGKASPQRLRLAYDELLASQLALAMVRNVMKRAHGHPIRASGKLRQQIMDALPFKLTQAQHTAIAEILSDMASTQRMIRLLQGDVGSGKTVVALMALAEAVEAGFQAALMAPTEILARQHYQTLSKLGAAAGLRTTLLTGHEKGSVRSSIETDLRNGEIDILVGTHALFQENVRFKSLGLAVIDEQHRFGVHQRLALQAKAAHAVDILAMTATPIPRTLSLTIYGDMDTSSLTEKPVGRKPIETSTISTQRTESVISGIYRKLQAGARVYWVCPLIEESEMLDVAHAEKRFEDLQAAFPGQVNLVHGRLKNAQKDKAIEEFRTGVKSILVSTTVIEVGVDVPQATVMIIENAERFGLSQLHQLRGRVGRGADQSHCILLYQEPLGETARARLSILRETDDGFRIAEEDLKLRGAGEVLGTQQSGLPTFRLADPVQHADLMAVARDDATLILRQDPALHTPRGKALRILLYLFEREEAIRLLDAG
jgi:ATP-dependent DNA helicase RecG